MNYLEIIKNVLNNGVQKQATRYNMDGSVIPVENGTIGTFCEIFRHNMSDGFPLTTLRKMPWKSIRVELEGFIKGITSKKWYQNRGCKFWDQWANPLAVSKTLLDKENNDLLVDIVSLPISGDEKGFNDAVKNSQLLTDDLGPIYGYQWKSFNKTYVPYQSEDDGDFNSFTNQLKSIVSKLHNSPYDRRMVCSAWNPNQMHMMALPPCHWAFNVVVYGDKLNLIWHQRSCDLLLGVGSNIASYALLLLLLCEESGLKPGELVGTLADCHIYENHLEAAKQLISRQETTLPSVKIKRKSDGSFSIFDWNWNHVEIIGYNPQEPIDVGAVTV